MRKGKKVYKRRSYKNQKAKAGYAFYCILNNKIKKKKK